MLKASANNTRHNFFSISYVARRGVTQMENKLWRVVLFGLRLDRIGGDELDGWMDGWRESSCVPSAAEVSDCDGDDDKRTDSKGDDEERDGANNICSMFFITCLPT